MKDIFDIFSFTKIFYDAFQLKLPLDNFPSQLQNLINLDVITLISKNKDTVIKNCYQWKDEAFHNFEKIGKLGSMQNEEKALIIESNFVQDSSFIKALKLFNERNFYILSNLVNNNSLDYNGRLSKFQILLSTYKGSNLSIPKELNSNQNFEDSKCLLEQPKTHERLKIQKEYLQRFIDSLSVHAFDNESSVKLSSLLNNEDINTDIKFSCPANSVINFFRRMGDEGIIVSTKEISGEFIQTYFQFMNKNEFKHPTHNNIVNYLKRTDAPNVSTKIILFEKG